MNWAFFMFHFIKWNILILKHFYIFYSFNKLNIKKLKPNQSYNFNFKIFKANVFFLDKKSKYYKKHYYHSFFLIFDIVLYFEPKN